MSKVNVKQVVKQSGKKSVKQKNTDSSEPANLASFFGGLGRVRTYDQSVMSRPLCR